MDLIDETSDLIDKKLRGACKKYNVSFDEMLNYIIVLNDIYEFRFQEHCIKNDCIYLCKYHLDKFIDIKIWYDITHITFYINRRGSSVNYRKKIHCSIMRITEYLDEIGLEKNIPIMKIAQPDDY